MNQHYGLIAFGDAALLFLQYAFISAVIAYVAKMSLTGYERSIVFAFIILCAFFLFGAIKDLLENSGLPQLLTSYRVLLPLVFVVILGCFFALKYKKTTPVLLARYVATLFVIFLIYETIFLAYNFFTRTSEPDFGDVNHTLVEERSTKPGSIKPDIFWIVMDEYSASETLRRKWGFENPLDSVLRGLKFFVADSATGPYNFTHYSMDAMLDMTYLAGLDDGSVVGYKDMVLGDKSVYETNVVNFLQRNGYSIKNLTMFDMKGMPAHPFIEFSSQPSRLISDNTMYARIRRDIGWNFSNLLSKDKNKGDAMQMKQSFLRVAAERDSLIRLYKNEIARAQASKKPDFLMLQLMLTHEPFLYNADGSIHPKASFTNNDAYITSVAYANNVVARLCKEIISNSGSQDVVIIFQSDHGFKFDQSDPLFSHGCRIPFAVYSSDHNNQAWMNNVAGVNIFRILFNKYFNTQFPILDTRTHLLRYRR